MKKFSLLAIILLMIGIQHSIAQWSAPIYFSTSYGNRNVNMYKNSQYKVVLANDSILEGKGTINDKDGKSFLVMKKSNRIINPSETKSITMYLKKDTVNGTPLVRYNIWLIDKNDKEKQDETGIITMYPMSYENNKTYIIDSTGTIIEATRDYLLPIVGKDKKAVKQLNDWKIREAIGTYNSHIQKSIKK